MNCFSVYRSELAAALAEEEEEGGGEEEDESGGIGGEGDPVAIDKVLVSSLMSFEGS